MKARVVELDDSTRFIEFPQGPDGVEDSQAWPEPLPLPDSLPPVAAFDFTLLPDSLRPWAEDICERIQCPPDYVAVTVMVGLGAVWAANSVCVPSPARIGRNIRINGRC